MFPVEKKKRALFEYALTLERGFSFSVGVKSLARDSTRRRPGPRNQPQLPIVSNNNKKKKKQAAAEAAVSSSWFGGRQAVEAVLYRSTAPLVAGSA